MCSSSRSHNPRLVLFRICSSRTELVQLKTHDISQSCGPYNKPIENHISYVYNSLLPPAFFIFMNVSLPSPRRLIDKNAEQRATTDPYPDILSGYVSVRAPLYNYYRSILFHSIF